MPRRRADPSRAARRPVGRHGPQVAEQDELFGAVLAEHGAALSAFTRSLSPTPADADDLLQETLVRAWQHPEALDGSGGSTRSWLFSVARNIAVDRWRKLGRHQSDQPVDNALEASGSQVTGSAERVVEDAMVSVALQHLSADHREVLIHTVWLDKSIAQTAADLGVPPGTVKSRVHYALVSLRLALEEMGYLR